jgi:Ni,Fe-hydrogenase III component G
MLQNLDVITAETLLAAVQDLHNKGYRLVTLTCIDATDNYDILYHFDRDYVLYNLRLCMPKGVPVPSISGIYFAAALVENEMKDLFGINFTGLAIDYGGRFLLAEDAPTIPMGNQPIVGSKKGE